MLRCSEGANDAHREDALKGWKLADTNHFIDLPDAIGTLSIIAVVKDARRILACGRREGGSLRSLLRTAHDHDLIPVSAQLLIRSRTSRRKRKAVNDLRRPPA